MTEIEIDATDRAQRRVLRWVLGINLAQAVVVVGIGVFADSTGLMGAGLDNLADAAVYGVSLYAVGHTLAAKARAARLSGTFLILLGVGLLVEVIRRFVTGAEPVGLVMILTALANAATNLVVLWLLRKHRDEGVHMKASWIFTGNDMAANAGIVVSGLAVIWLRSPIPDLVIGIVVAGIAIRGGWDILDEARDARRQSRHARLPPIS